MFVRFALISRLKLAKFFIKIKCLTKAQQNTDIKNEYVYLFIMAVSLAFRIYACESKYANFFDIKNMFLNIYYNCEKVLLTFIRRDVLSAWFFDTSA